MANQDNSGNGASGNRSSPNDDSIARLMRLAGPRPDIPANVRDRVHDTVRKEWQSHVARRRTLRWGIPTALAATIVLAVALNTRDPGVTLAPIATIVLVDGNGATTGVRWSPGDKVYPGDSIESGHHGVALAVNNGLSLRLAAGTTATFDDIDELTVASGSIYADSGTSINYERSITVHTNAGSATDTGTQFAVTYLDGKMSVAVREGSVDVSDYRGSYTAEAGDRLTLDPDEEVVFERVPVSDSSWDWAVDLAPPFDIDDRPLLDFLKWAARETGKELVFANDEVRLAVGVTRLHGSVTGFTPSEAIASVQRTTQFQFRMNERQINISILPQ